MEDITSRISKTEIAERIKTLRNNAEYTQEEVAEKIGFTYNAYVKLENAYNFPSLNVLVRLSDIYSISIDWIVFGNNDNAKADLNKYDEIDQLLKICNEKSLKQAEEIIKSLANLIKKY